MFIFGFLSPLIGNGSMADWEYDLLLGAIYDLSAPDVHSYYPPDSDDARITLSTLMTDYLFICPSNNNSLYNMFILNFRSQCSCFNFTTWKCI
jgi:hypothetical protein